MRNNKEKMWSDKVRWLMIGQYDLLVKKHKLTEMVFYLWISKWTKSRDKLIS
jgi:hypothetical protein